MLSDDCEMRRHGTHLVSRQPVEKRAHAGERPFNVAVALAPEQGRAAVGPVEAQKNPEGRALAGPVGPQERGHLAGGGREAHAVKNLDAPMALSQLAYGDAVDVCLYVGHMPALFHYMICKSSLYQVLLACQVSVDLRLDDELGVGARGHEPAVL